ncbi:MAG: sigma-70 family RNA polymerase sigma factor, partial [Planctomycetales bacterium]|nr:sigma-70 family RNA polymerase sigma factor [Planctomycetales bacterium]
LAAEHFDRLYAYAFRLTGAADAADDLTQQTFLVAQQRLDQLQHRERAGGWLMRILRNLFLKNCRRRMPLAASQLELEVDEIGDTATVESAYDEERIQLTLRQLPDDYRAVVLMFYFEDLSYREIADELNLSLGTVMSRLSRAKAQLRRLLGTLERVALR